MRLSPAERQQVINYLVHNCECWQGSGDRDTLSTFSDEKLAQLKTAAVKSNAAIGVANAAVNGFTDGGTAYRINPETGRWERSLLSNKEEDEEERAMNRRKARNRRRTRNQDEEEEEDEDEREMNRRKTRNRRRTRNQDEDEDEEETENAEDAEDDEDEMENRRTRNRWRTRNVDGVLVEVDEDEDDEMENRRRTRNRLRTRNADGTDEADEDDETRNMEEEDEEYRRKENRRRMTGNRRRKPQTQEQIINSLPADLRETFRVAREVEQREKDQLIREIIANSNISEAQRPPHYERLQTESVEKLRYMLSLIPRTPSQEELNRAASTTANTRSSRQTRWTDDDMLVAPTLNWQEVGKDGDDRERTGTQGASTAVGNAAEFGSDEDWIKSAPPSVRAAVQNAMVIENRERRKLIDELTANIVDEDAERRLRSRLQNKSLDELRELLMLAPKKDTRANYFGAATPPLGNQQRTADVHEDILPIPSTDWREEAARRSNKA